MYLRNAINLDINPGVCPDVVADFHSLPFRNKAFDTILALDVIEHSSRPNDFISELERVCKNGGNIIVESCDFDIVPTNWVADKDHKTYVNERTFRELTRGKYVIFNFGRDMLIAVRKPSVFDKLFYKFLTILIESYRIVTMQPKGRATHWR
jgi:ubiquinone/menaquinone biosynthesis C-methylase UbiE